MKENLDTINIELKVIADQKLDLDIWMIGKLEIFINGEHPYSQSDLIDTDLLLKSLESDGEYFIFYCCCGIPECSGWIKGISVTHFDDIIKWEDSNTNRIWYLDRKIIESELQVIREEVKTFKDYFSAKGIEYIGVGYDW